MENSTALLKLSFAPLLLVLITLGLIACNDGQQKENSYSAKNDNSDLCLAKDNDDHDNGKSGKGKDKADEKCRGGDNDDAGDEGGGGANDDAGDDSPSTSESILGSWLGLECIEYEGKFYLNAVTITEKTITVNPKEVFSDSSCQKPTSVPGKPLKLKVKINETDEDGAYEVDMTWPDDTTAYFIFKVEDGVLFKPSDSRSNAEDSLKKSKRARNFKNAFQYKRATPSGDDDS